MKYQKSDKTFGEYPQSFGSEDLTILEEFLDLGTQTMGHSTLYPGDKTVVMRHDVDHNLEHAAKFAKWEYDRDLTSTYFVLHTAWYYKDTDALIALLTEIEGYGHEIGIHNDAVSLAWQEGHRGSNLWTQAGRILGKEVDFLHIEGFHVVGAAAHGGAGPHNNLELWDHVGMANLGIQYEAYQLSSGQNYISDNRGKWNAPLEHVEGKRTYMLIHPCHWDLP